MRIGGTAGVDAERAAARAPAVVGLAAQLETARVSPGRPFTDNRTTVPDCSVERAARPLPALPRSTTL